MKMITSRILQISLLSAIFFSSFAAAPFSPPTISTRTDTDDILEALGGVPCYEGSAFICVTLEVPLDHFNPADARTIPVVFAVLPASGERQGMFVNVTGGPGTSGVYLAESYIENFDPAIFESFDVVFFDQRGIGLSGGLTCPVAATDYYRQDAQGVTPAQEQALKETASTFVSDCMNELGSTELLPFLGTRQAVEDLERFRQVMGDEKIWMWAESYGTQYAQTYAAAHGDHLAGLILDGTVDLTLSGFEYYSQQVQAFNDTLVATLSACNEDPVCAQQMNGDAIAAYDRLAATLSQQALAFRFPLPQGGFDRRYFTLSDLEFVAASQLYYEDDRMMFTRALAAFESNGDLIPLARLLYIDLVVDPQTLAPIPDPSWSDAMFYAVECQDYGYPGATPDERAELYLDAADPVEAAIPRLASIFYGDLPCAYWPHASADQTRPGYLVAEGVPTLVLGATADPATPVSHGYNVYQHLADGYLITTEGGPHVTFGYGNECPDTLVTAFLVHGVVPEERETVCEGSVAEEYVPVAPRSTRSFRDPSDVLPAVETEISYLPEFYYWDQYTPTSVGCTYGGTFQFEANKSGKRSLFELRRCELIANFSMTGEGFYNSENDRFVLDIRTTGRWACNLRYVRVGEKLNVTGKCDGKSIRADRVDHEHEKHQMPGFQEAKHR
jgi:pimeloyl-ACP methyl ester carboxylesterase